MAENNVLGYVDAKNFLKICFLSGFVFGVIVGVAYSIPYFLDGRIGRGFMLVIAAPFANGVMLFLYGLLGYPVYRLLSKKRLVGFGVVRIENEE